MYGSPSLPLTGNFKCSVNNALFQNNPNLQYINLKMAASGFLFLGTLTQGQKGMDGGITL